MLRSVACLDQDNRIQPNIVEIVVRYIRYITTVEALSEITDLSKGKAGLIDYGTYKFYATVYFDM